MYVKPLHPLSPTFAIVIASMPSSSFRTLSSSRTPSTYGPSSAGFATRLPQTTLSTIIILPLGARRGSSYYTGFEGLSALEDEVEELPSKELLQRFDGGPNAKPDLRRQAGMVKVLPGNSSVLLLELESDNATILRQHPPDPDSRVPSNHPD